MYVWVKNAHLLFVGASLLLFALRGGMALVVGRPLQHPLWRRLPPLVDTLLLACGIWLMLLLGLDPLRTPWLGVKLLCVAGYIVLGILAFRLPGPRGARLALFLTALALFGFIVSIALLHDPRGIFSLSGWAQGAHEP